MNEGSETTEYVRVRTGPLWKRAKVTWVIIAMNILWYFLIETPRGFTTGGYIASVALYRFCFDHGGWYLLFASMFVHFDITHILFNMVSLGSLYVIEIVIGAYPFIFLYGLSGLIGALASVWLQPYGLFGGASGAIFGIFGVALLLSFKGVFPKGVRNQLLFWLGLNMVFDFVQPNIDIIAHLAGLGVGMLGIWLLLGHRRWLKWVRYGAWIISVVGVVALIQAAVVG